MRKLLIVKILAISVFLPTKAYAVKSVMEGIYATGCDIFVDTVNARVTFGGCTEYSGGQPNVGLFSSSNSWVGTTSGSTGCLTTSTGSISCTGSIGSPQFLGNGSQLTGIPSTSALGGYWNASGSNIYNNNAGNVGILTKGPLFDGNNSGLEVSNPATITGGLDGQIRISTNPGAVERLNLGYDSTLDKGFIQASHVGVAQSDLLLNPINGNVGILTKYPLFDGNNKGLEIAVPVTYAGGNDGQIRLSTGPGAVSRTIIGYDGTNDFGFLAAVKVGVANEPLVLNPNGGNIGISQKSPSNQLDVNGGVTSRGINTVGYSTDKNDNGYCEWARWAKSVDGASQSAGCLVAANYGATNSSSAQLIFTSTTTQPVWADVNRIMACVLMETCAPGAICRICCHGDALITVDGGGIGNNFVQFSTTRCQAAADASVSFGIPLNTGAITSDKEWIYLIQ